MAQKKDTKKELNDLKADVKAETSDIRSEITTTNERIEEVDKRIEDRTAIKVVVAEDPKSCVAVGTGKSLDILEKLESSSLNRRAPYL